MQSFVAVYVAAFERLGGRDVSLDDVVKAVVDANLATSSGYMGVEAVLRSTRKDRSRDPLYNQLKMYAELFRALGWLHPTEQSKLHYTFTLLGEQLVTAGSHYLPLFQECVLGIAYPSAVLTVKGDYALRPLAFILRTMQNADGYLSRDEIIVGPLSQSSDRSPKAATDLGQAIKASSDNALVAKQLVALAAKRETQINTLRNYTRWPLAVLRHCGWTSEGSAPYRSRGTRQVWTLTESGRAAAQRIESMLDLRLSDLEHFEQDEKNALIISAHYAMLGRAGFDLSPVARMLERNRTTVKRALDRLKLPSDRDLLFSPFQTISVTDIERAFPSRQTVEPVSGVQHSVKDGALIGRGSRDHLFVKPKLISLLVEVGTTSAGSPLDATALAVRSGLSDLLKTRDSLTAAVEAFVAKHADDAQPTFYPLVTHLFQILGYRSQCSRVGVNYQRWDAAVWIGDAALPVEIKSPSEEIFLSTKSVRQALENKVILLSRGGLSTSRNLSSLIVGYKIPNMRGDLSMLVDDIFKTFGLRIGVIDFVSLVTLTLRSINDRVTIEPDQLSSLCGFLNV